jgi:hypothetical protein
MGEALGKSTVVLAYLPQHDGVNDCVLAGEVAVDVWPGDADFCGDVLDAGAGDAPAGEAPCGRVNDGRCRVLADRESGRREWGKRRGAALAARLWRFAQLAGPLPAGLIQAVAIGSTFLIR